LREKQFFHNKIINPYCINSYKFTAASVCFAIFQFCVGCNLTYIIIIIIIINVTGFVIRTPIARLRKGHGGRQGMEMGGVTGKTWDGREVTV